MVLSALLLFGSSQKSAASHPHRSPQTLSPLLLYPPGYGQQDVGVHQVWEIRNLISSHLGLNAYSLWLIFKAILKIQRRKMRNTHSKLTHILIDEEERLMTSLWWSVKCRTKLLKLLCISIVMKSLSILKCLLSVLLLTGNQQSHPGSSLSHWLSLLTKGSVVKAKGMEDLGMGKIWGSYVVFHSCYN